MKLVDLGLTEYRQTYGLQQNLAAARKNGKLDEDLVLVTEHHPVFTLGRRGGRQNLVVSEAFLAQRGIQVVHIERGGDITYHGPGQLVIYPIVHLRQSGYRVAEYVGILEEVMLRLAARCGIEANRDPRNHGIWVGDEKLGSVGIAIRHGVSFHGLALNCSLSLEPFSWVNPCGLTNVRMTSLSQLGGREIGPQVLKSWLQPLLSELFGQNVEEKKNCGELKKYEQLHTRAI